MNDVSTNSLSITFRKAVDSDISFLIALRKETMTEHLLTAGLMYTDEQHIARITEHFEDSYIICFDDVSIGLIKLAQFKEKWHIRQLQIARNYQGRGLGTKLLTLLQNKASQIQVPISLNVLFKNPARKLYQRAGFVIVGENSLEYQMLWRSK
ncbi:GNAT family N-acetyltransferase [Thalassotalea sp. 1_MG-2023]|uniref:GNAT family N-acetyltransferase n=1 Tax=Thalassotalea sp. 1_MG-2023 TaxID=3062680 RepID=UPI0026E41268|nr:GNAT family N-acetyltransferase [Thalassotalea sp. 1_MG-2023]MDO6426750.1 GNAT family N-acetyltransferase [Thalassotalea sp. 1_MG-2023]